MSSKSGLAAIARSKNSAIAEYCDRASIEGRERESGRGKRRYRELVFPVYMKRGATGHQNLEIGRPIARSSATVGAAATSCSKLSSRISVGACDESWKLSLSVSSGGFPPASRMPSV